MSVSCDDGWCSVHSEKYTTARKKHKCTACGGTILPGHIYVKTFAIFEGEPNSVKRCGRCETIYTHLQGMMQHSDEAPAWALDCGHEYWERWGVDPPPEIAALAFLTDEEAGKLLEKKP